MTWARMVAGSAGWRLAGIAILFVCWLACWFLLMFFNDMGLVDCRFFGVCCIRASDAVSDLFRCF